MAHVHLHFEDKDGKIFFRADYEGNWQSDSPAHKLANQVIKFLDAQAIEKINLAVDTEPTDAIQNGGNGDRPSLWVPGVH